MKTITFTDAEIEALRELLEAAEQEASCAGCNDFVLPNTETAGLFTEMPIFMLLVNVMTNLMMRTMKFIPMI